MSRASLSSPPTPSSSAPRTSDDEKASQAHAGARGQAAEASSATKHRPAKNASKRTREQEAQPEARAVDTQQGNKKRAPELSPSLSTPNPYAGLAPKTPEVDFAAGPNEVSIELVPAGRT